MVEITQIKELIEACGHLYFMQDDVQKSLEKHLKRLSKFTVDFSLTKHTLQESLRQLFAYDEPKT